MTEPPAQAPRTDRPSRPRARDGLRTIGFGDELVVLDAAGRQAHRLNHTAAAILDACDGRRSDDEVAEVVARSFGVAPRAVAAEVAGALAALAAAGLLLDEGAPERVAHPATPPAGLGPPVGGAGAGAGADESTRPPPAGARTLGPYRAGPARFVVVAADGAAAEAARFLQPLEVADDGSTPLRYVLGEHDGRTWLSLERRELGRFDDDAAALAYLEWHLNRQVIEGTQGRILLHAAGVGEAGAVVALPAAMDAGKSTLATALVQRGLDYVTDEALCIRPDDLVVEPYPKAITLEPGSFPLFPGLAAAAARIDPRYADRRWRLTPDDVRAGAQVGSGRVVVVVTPRYLPGAELLEEVLAPIDAFLALLEQAFACTFDDDEAMTGLVRIAEELPFVRVVHGGGPEVVDVVVRRLRTEAARAG